MSHPRIDDESAGTTKSVLKPCPFCAASLEKSEELSTRRAEMFVHAASEVRLCVLEGTFIWSTDVERVEAWNRRAATVTPAMVDLGAREVNPSAFDPFSTADIFHLARWQAEAKVMAAKVLCAATGGQLGAEAGAGQ